MRSVAPQARLPVAGEEQSPTGELSALPPIQVNALLGEDSRQRWGSQVWKRWIELPARFQRLTGAFLSGLLHGLLLIVLALLAKLDVGQGRRTLEIVSPRWSAEETPIFQLETAPPNTPVPDAEESPPTLPTALAVQSLEPIDDALQVGVGLPALATPSPVDYPVATDPVLGVRDALTPPMAAFMHSSLEGRALEKRQQLALSRGGSAASEQAVEAALAWLTTHQHRDGGWSTLFQLPDSPCFSPQGPLCSCGSTETLDQKRFAATGLALLTYLGAGYTHREGKYQRQVYQGLNFLMTQMKWDPPDARDPRLPGQFSSPLSRHQQYEQGIASLALCEAYQMTDDKSLEKHCQAAIDFISRSQHYDGSWGYFPQTPGDLSIVGWQLMGLKSANASGLLVDLNKVRKVELFLNSVQAEGGSKYRYRGPTPTRSMTAIGLLMRLYLGYPRSDPRMLLGARYVADKGPSTSDVYFNYYATQTLFQLESPLWPKWNGLLRDYLIQQQSKTGHEAGSWFFPDDAESNFNFLGGRLYTTTLSAMTLEVYYRYLPAYHQTDEQPFKL
jgi:hypothetical protein